MDHKPCIGPSPQLKTIGQFYTPTFKLSSLDDEVQHSISHVLGKLLFTADTLSKAPASTNHEDSTTL